MDRAGRARRPAGRAGRRARGWPPPARGRRGSAGAAPCTIWRISPTTSCSCARAPETSSSAAGPPVFSAAWRVSAIPASAGPRPSCRSRRRRRRSSSRAVTICPREIWSCVASATASSASASWALRISASATSAGRVRLARRAGAEHDAPERPAAVPELALERRLRRRAADADRGEAEPGVGLEQHARGAERLRRRAGEAGQRLARIELSAVELTAHARDRGRDVPVAVEHAGRPARGRARGRARRAARRRGRRRAPPARRRPGRRRRRRRSRTRRS